MKEGPLSPGEYSIAYEQDRLGIFDVDLENPIYDLSQIFKSCISSVDSPRGAELIDPRGIHSIFFFGDFVSTPVYTQGFEENRKWLAKTFFGPGHYVLDRRKHVGVIDLGVVCKDVPKRGHLREERTNRKTPISLSVNAFTKDSLTEAIESSRSYGGEIIGTGIPLVDDGFFQELVEAHPEIVRDPLYNLVHKVRDGFGDVPRRDVINAQLRFKELERNPNLKCHWNY